MPIRVFHIPIVIVLIALSACSPIEDRTRDGLIRAGLSPKLAACMAKPMAKELSIAQLRKLAALGDAGGDSADGKGHGRKHLLRRIRSLDDPQIVSVTATAAALCSVGLG